MWDDAALNPAAGALSARCCCCSSMRHAKKKATPRAKKTRSSHTNSRNSQLASPKRHTKNENKDAEPCTRKRAQLRHAASSAVRRNKKRSGKHKRAGTNKREGKSATTEASAKKDTHPAETPSLV
jgi:hypothetical protein